MEAVSVYPKVRSALLNSLLLISLTSFDSLLKVSKLVVLLTLFYHLKAEIPSRRPGILQPMFTECLIWVGWRLDCAWSHAAWSHSDSHLVRTITTLSYRWLHMYHILTAALGLDKKVCITFPVAHRVFSFHYHYCAWKNDFQSIIPVKFFQYSLYISEHSFLWSRLWWNWFPLFAVSSKTHFALTKKGEMIIYMNGCCNLAYIYNWLDSSWRSRRD